MAEEREAGAKAAVERKTKKSTSRKKRRRGNGNATTAANASAPALSPASGVNFEGFKGAVAAAAQPGTVAKAHDGEPKAGDKASNSNPGGKGSSNAKNSRKPLAPASKPVKPSAELEKVLRSELKLSGGMGKQKDIDVHHVSVLSSSKISAKVERTLKLLLSASAESDSASRSGAQVAASDNDYDGSEVAQEKKGTPTPVVALRGKSPVGAKVVSIAQIVTRLVNERNEGLLVREFVDVEGVPAPPKAKSRPTGGKGGGKRKRGAEEVVEDGMGSGNADEEEDAFENALEVVGMGKRERERQDVWLTVYLAVGSSEGEVKKSENIAVKEKS
ncbi:MAG: hypothetical protein M1831_006668 [Alyxoria varia]|nr:MAG: hypothetical protein M1831_006668 [Alyxoria varia]